MNDERKRGQKLKSNLNHHKFNDSEESGTDDDIDRALEEVCLVCGEFGKNGELWLKCQLRQTLSIYNIPNQGSQRSGDRKEITSLVAGGVDNAKVEQPIQKRSSSSLTFKLSGECCLSVLQKVSVEFACRLAILPPYMHRVAIKLSFESIIGKH
ncbi:hypothetical protein FQA39_LY03934 [Lamprigera yunnana]|nr:hypothetical protein FQA39_LY03934 [Lamprigera yunnana]